MATILRSKSSGLIIRYNGLVAEYFPPIPEPSALHFYPFETDSSTYWIIDTVGDVSIISSEGKTSTYVDGKVGKALMSPYMDSSIDNVRGMYYSDELISIFAGNNAWSISGWYNINPSSNIDGCLFNVAQAAVSRENPGCDLHFNNVTKQISFRRFRIEAAAPPYNPPDNSSYTVTDASLFEGWHYFVCTADNSIHKLYIDNEFKGDFYSSLPIEDSVYSDEFSFKCNRFAFCAEYIRGDAYVRNPYDGLVDQFRIFDRVLSQSEIDYFWNNGNGI